MLPAEILQITHHRGHPLPKRPWMVRQMWKDVIFLHWQCAPHRARRLLPKDALVELDLYNGTAWISIVAFVVKAPGIRHLPPIFRTAQFHELNLRTYVTDGKRQGVYFSSIRADNHLVVWLNRIAGLPYRFGNVDIDRSTLKYKNKQTDIIDIRWSADEQREKTKLDTWLTERYFDFQKNGEQWYCFPIHHLEWPLQQASVTGSIHFHCGSGVELTEDNLVLAHYALGVDALLWMKEKIEPPSRNV